MTTDRRGQPPSGHLQQRRLTEDAGERVQLGHKLPELSHRQLVVGFPSARSVPRETKAHGGGMRTGVPAPQTPATADSPGVHTQTGCAQSPPRLPLAIKQLLGDRGALLRVLRD